MKLYTKEMFLKAAEKCEVSIIDAEHIMKYIDEYVTPIELPSDAEIDTFINAPRYYKMCPTEYREGIEEGAKWMRDKIQEGVK